MLAQNQGVFMGIKKVTDDYIEFDTGDTLRSYHMPACCEDNYAALRSAGTFYAVERAAYSRLA